MITLNLALQILGISLYTIGTILAIVELWKSFSFKIIKKLALELDEFRKISESFYNFIQNAVGNKDIDIKIQNKGLKYVVENKSRVNDAIYKLEKRISRHAHFIKDINKFVKLGVFLIIIGALIQIIGMLL